MVLPCASVMVIMVLLKDAFTWATPEVMFFFSRRRTLARPAGACSLLINRLSQDRGVRGPCAWVIEERPKLSSRNNYAFFLPAIAFAGPLRVRALVWVRWPCTGRPLR